MTLKKFRAKTHKGISKRIKLSAGGKIQVNRPNRQHRMIGKSRARVLKGKKSTVINPLHKKLLALIHK